MRASDVKELPAEADWDSINWPSGDSQGTQSSLSNTHTHAHMRTHTHTHIARRRVSRLLAVWDWCPVVTPQSWPVSSFTPPKGAHKAVDQYMNVWKNKPTNQSTGHSMKQNNESVNQLINKTDRWLRE